MCRDNGDGFYGNAGAILVADRSGHSREVLRFIENGGERLLPGMGFPDGLCKEECRVPAKSRKGVGLNAGRHGVVGAESGDLGL